MATARTVDFSNVKDGGNFNKKRIPSGDYKAKITKVEDAKVKATDEFQYLVTIQIVSRPSSVFPYYCQLTEKSLWKLRNLLIAAGKSVPKKKTKVDINSIVGKFIGVSIDDTEFDGKEQSEITGVFPAAELTEGDEPSDDEDDETEDDEEETSDDDVDADEDVSDDEGEEAEEEAEPEIEEEEEEEADGDEYDAMDRIALRKFLVKLDGTQSSKSQTDDDLRELIRAKQAAKATAAAKKKPATVIKAKAKPADEVSDEELEELDIDDI